MKRQPQKRPSQKSNQTTSLKDDKMPPINKDEIELIGAEYGSLQAEILKLVEFRNQLINLLLIILGITLTVGLQPSSSPNILFAYPILTSLLAFGWINNGIKILSISKYIRENIETKAKNLRYYTYLSEQFPSLSPFETKNTITTLGFVVITQILTTILGFIRGISTIMGTAIASVSLLAIIITLVMAVGLANIKKLVKRGDAT